MEKDGIGVKWNAIDFKAKTLTIRHIVGRGKIDGVTQFIFKDRANKRISASVISDKLALDTKKEQIT